MRIHAKNPNKESRVMMVTELKIDAIPNGNIPTIIMVYNKRWSFCTGFIKGLKKFFMTFWVQIEQTL